MSIVHLLIQFVFRITFGVALAMGVTSSPSVTSGFFRVHLWVLMGLSTLASLAIHTQRESWGQTIGPRPVALGLAVGLAVVSYAAAVMWLYEKRGAGRFALWIIALGGLIAAACVIPHYDAPSTLRLNLNVLDMVSSGLLLGGTLSAVFLGHWYLNTPMMELGPLRRLVILMAAAIAARALVSGTGLVFHVQSSEQFTGVFWIFLALRWLSGLLGASLLAVMTWYSLKVPNTQSATGILYAGVILVFIGELTSQYLSSDAMYPL